MISIRLAQVLPVALCLSLPSAGKAAGPQEPSTTNAAGQTPAAPAPAASVPAETPSDSGKATPEGVTKNSAVSTGSGKGSAKHRKHPAQAPNTQAPNNGPLRVVVREGGADEPAAQIVPDLTPAEAARQRQKAERWLGSTGDELKRLAGRTLNTQQQETVGQIRNYIGGAQLALQEGDVQRAGTLAEKAHLLTQDLMKQ